MDIPPKDVAQNKSVVHRGGVAGFAERMQAYSQFGDRMYGGSDKMLRFLQYTIACFGHQMDRPRRAARTQFIGRCTRAYTLAKVSRPCALLHQIYIAAGYMPTAAARPLVRANCAQWCADS
eukprot:SAG11_NODE_1344_length_5148_cov_5.463260_4_plen_121_part_00